MKRFLPMHMGGHRKRQGRIKRFPLDARDVDIPQRNVGNPVAAMGKRLSEARKSFLVAALLLLGSVFLLRAFPLH